MIGIYKITNIRTGQVYIGQSKNLEKRKYQHWHRKTGALDSEIYNEPDNFIFEILEECSIDKLSERESFYIKENLSTMKGYNCAIGGCVRPGESNSNSKLKLIDVISIRSAYANHENKKDVYERYKDIISWRGFEKVWSGITWKHVMMEVYNDENKYYYTHNAKSVEQESIFTDKEVFEFRNRYVNETGREIYNSIGGEEKCSYGTFEQLLIGATHKNVPIYKKNRKEWINLKQIE